MTDACETHAMQDIGSGAAGEPGVTYDINGLGEPGDPGVPTGGQYPTNERENKAHSGRTASLPTFLVLEVQAHPAEFVDPAPDSYVPGAEGSSSYAQLLSHHLDKARQQAGVPLCTCTTCDTPAIPFAAETGAHCASSWNAWDTDPPAPP
jgi:hypothetical protein